MIISICRLLSNTGLLLFVIANTAIGGAMLRLTAYNNYTSDNLDSLRIKLSLCSDSNITLLPLNEAVCWSMLSVKIYSNNMVKKYVASAAMDYDPHPIVVNKRRPNEFVLPMNMQYIWTDEKTKIATLKPIDVETDSIIFYYSPKSPPGFTSYWNGEMKSNVLRISRQPKSFLQKIKAFLQHN